MRYSNNYLIKDNLLSLVSIIINSSEENTDMKTYSQTLELENKEKMNSFLVEEKLNFYNFITNSNIVPNLNDKNDYYISFNFYNGGCIQKPKNNYLRAFIQTNYIEFYYTYNRINNKNVHKLENNDNNLEFYLTGYPQHCIFYDSIGMLRSLTFQIIKANNLDNMTPQEAYELRKNRKDDNKSKIRKNSVDFDENINLPRNPTTGEVDWGYDEVE